MYNSFLYSPAVRDTVMFWESHGILCHHMHCLLACLLNESLCTIPPKNIAIFKDTAATCLTSAFACYPISWLACQSRTSITPPDLKINNWSRIEITAQPQERRFDHRTPYIAVFEAREVHIDMRLANAARRSPIKALAPSICQFTSLFPTRDHGAENTIATPTLLTQFVWKELGLSYAVHLYKLQSQTEPRSMSKPTRNFT